MPDELLSVKELAAKLKRSESYVWCMVRIGFRMTGGRATLERALRFLSKNPKPCRRNGSAEGH